MIVDKSVFLDKCRFDLIIVLLTKLHFVYQIFNLKNMNNFKTLYFVYLLIWILIFLTVKESLFYG